MSAAKFIVELASQGKYTFTTADAKNFLGCSDVAVRAALRRLRQKGDIAMPCRGFYVIVPPEYRSLGCLPPEQFIHALMEHQGESYYIGLLSAGLYHGASRRPPQALQVVVAKNKAPIVCGKIRIEFVARKGVAGIPTVTINTPRGPVLASCPGSTALDLVGYPQHAGGMDNLAMLLSEFGGNIDGDELPRLAELSPVAWAQRLGYLLDLVGMQVKTKALAGYIVRKKPVPAILATSLPAGNAPKDPKWLLKINCTFERKLP